MCTARSLIFWRNLPIAKVYELLIRTLIKFWNGSRQKVVVSSVVAWLKTFTDSFTISESDLTMLLTFSISPTLPVLPCFVLEVLEEHFHSLGWRRGTIMGLEMSHYLLFQKETKCLSTCRQIIPEMWIFSVQ